MNPVQPRQRFRVGLDEIPDDVLEQIAHAGDCATSCNVSSLGETDPGDAEGLAMARAAIMNTPGFSGWSVCPLDASDWREWRRAARWAARKLGVEVK